MIWLIVGALVGAVLVLALMMGLGLAAAAKLGDQILEMQQARRLADLGLRAREEGRTGVEILGWDPENRS